MDNPIVVGLAGNICSGKTVCGDYLAPSGRPSAVTEDENSSSKGIVWEHLYFALPLYEMARIKQDTEGDLAKDRIRYQIHDVLLSIFGKSPAFGAPPYSTLIEMVEKITNFPLPKEGKPREFLQKVGTEICRAWDPNCWTKWMTQQVRKDHRAFLADETHDEDIEHAFIITDCRFPNEVEWVKAQPRSVAIKLTASPEVVKERIWNRDGIIMSEEQLNHVSEKAVNEIPEELFDYHVDTSTFTVEEQVQHIMKLVREKIGL